MELRHKDIALRYPRPHLEAVGTGDMVFNVQNLLKFQSIKHLDIAINMMHSCLLVCCISISILFFFV